MIRPLLLLTIAASVCAIIAGILTGIATYRLMIVYWTPAAMDMETQIRLAVIRNAGLDVQLAISAGATLIFGAITIFFALRSRSAR